MMLSEGEFSPGPCQLFEKWIMLSTGQITIQWIAWFVLSTFIHCTVLYLVDSAIQSSNHRGLIDKIDVI